MEKTMRKPALAAWLCGLALFFSACGPGEKKETAETTESEVAEGTAAEDTAGQATIRETRMPRMMEHMHENMQDMQAVEMSGDPDLDFARMMATHHQGAIDMAEEEIANGKDAEMKALASKIATASKAEKEKLEDFADEHKAAASDTSASMKLMQPMKTMMGSMKHDTAGTTDHHFASMMSMHHQGGIDMMKAYVGMAKVPTMKSMTQKMMEDQQKEKKELDAWLKKNAQ